MGEVARHVTSTVWRRVDSERVGSTTAVIFGEKIKLGRARNRKSRLETAGAENGMEQKESFEHKVRGNNTPLKRGTERKKERKKIERVPSAVVAHFTPWPR